MQVLPGIHMKELRRLADLNWDALTSRGLKATGTTCYDKYLARGAEMLLNGASEAEAGDYFVDVSIERLGVDTGSGIRERAQIFAVAIRDYLESIAQPVS